MKAFVAEADWKPRKDYPLTDEENRRKRAIVGSQAWQKPRFAIKTFTPSMDNVALKRVSHIH